LGQIVEGQGLGHGGDGPEVAARGRGEARGGRATEAPPGDGDDGRAGGRWAGGQRAKVWCVEHDGADADGKGPFVSEGCLLILLLVQLLLLLLPLLSYELVYRDAT
jgi:hypothetical protein